MMRQREKDHKQYRYEVVDRTERPSGECCAASDLMSTHNITLYQSQPALGLGYSLVTEQPRPPIHLIQNDNRGHQSGADTAAQTQNICAGERVTVSRSLVQRYSQVPDVHGGV